MFWTIISAVFIIYTSSPYTFPCASRSLRFTVVLYNSSVYHYAGWWKGDYSCTVQQFSLSLCRLVEGGLKLYCTTVQFIIMQVGGGGITVVLYYGSAYHYAGWREDYSFTVQQFSLLLCRLEGGLQLYCKTVQLIIMQVGGRGLQLYCTTLQVIIMQVGGGITVVLYNGSAYHNAGWWRGD